MATEISPDECILRRVHKDFVDANKPVPIQLIAFRPNKNDTEGLSFFRESLVSPEELLETARQPVDKYVVVRLRVVDIHRLGLTVIEDEVHNLPGHCLVPELNTASYKADRHVCTRLIDNLCRLASQDIIEMR